MKVVILCGGLGSRLSETKIKAKAYGKNWKKTNISSYNGNL